MSRSTGDASSFEVPKEIDPYRIALGIQQPWIELILRGVKTIEVRSQPIAMRASIYLYASQRWSSLEAASVAAAKFELNQQELPKGLLVGQVDLCECRPIAPADYRAACLPKSSSHLQGYAWILDNPVRFKKPIAVRYLPYGVWFYPFLRKNRDPQS